MRKFLNIKGDRLWPSIMDTNGAFLIDRSPVYFEPLLNYLRHGQMILDKTINAEGNIRLLLLIRSRQETFKYCYIKRLKLVDANATTSRGSITVRSPSLWVWVPFQRTALLGPL